MRVDLPEPDELARALADEIIRTDRMSNAAAGFHEEAHYQAGLAHWLRSERDIFTVVEATYSGAKWRERCDLCLMDHDGDKERPSAWIEVKKAWLGNGAGWNTKPSEQLRKLLWDLAKLSGQISTAGPVGYTAVVFYSQREARFHTEPNMESKPPSSEHMEVLRQWSDKGAFENVVDWNRVREMFGIPAPVDGRQLLWLYTSVLRTVGEVATHQVAGRKDDLDYIAVVGRIVAAQEG